MKQTQPLDPTAQPFVKVEDAAAFLGIGRPQAYAAVHAGEIPSIRVGRSYRIPTAALLRLAAVDNT